MSDYICRCGAPRHHHDFYMMYPPNDCLMYQDAPETTRRVLPALLELLEERDNAPGSFPSKS